MRIVRLHGLHFNKYTISSDFSVVKPGLSLMTYANSGKLYYAIESSCNICFFSKLYCLEIISRYINVMVALIEYTNFVFMYAIKSII